MIMKDYSIILFEITNGVVIGISTGTSIVIPVYLIWYNVIPSYKAIYTGLYIYFTWVIKDTITKSILSYAWFGKLCGSKKDIDK
jgi:hypothetical protein